MQASAEMAIMVGWSFLGRASVVGIRTLSDAVSGGHDAAILGGPAQAVEHAPGSQRHFADGLFAIAFIAKKPGYPTDPRGGAFHETRTRNRSACPRARRFV